MLESEPTLEDVAETQSLHAWSQEDPATEVVDYRARSWRLPVALAVAAAVGVVGATVWLEKPQQSATKPQVAPTVIQSPPQARPLSQDERFLALLKQRGAVVISPPLAVNGAHETCTNLAKGFTARQIAQAFVNATPAENLNTAGTFVATAQEVYCP